jgi:hypothetical protein
MIIICHNTQEIHALIAARDAADHHKFHELTGISSQAELMLISREVLNRLIRVRID